MGGRCVRQTLGSKRGKNVPYSYDKGGGRRGRRGITFSQTPEFRSSCLKGKEKKPPPLDNAPTPTPHQQKKKKKKETRINHQKKVKKLQKNQIGYLPGQAWLVEEKKRGGRLPIPFLPGPRKGGNPSTWGGLFLIIHPEERKRRKKERPVLPLVKRGKGKKKKRRDAAYALLDFLQLQKKALPPSNFKKEGNGRLR